MQSGLKTKQRKRKSADWADVFRAMEYRSLKEVSRKMVQILAEQWRDATEILAQRVKPA